MTTQCPVVPVVRIPKEKLREKGGPYTLQAGTALKVVFVTGEVAQQQGLLLTEALPIFVMNEDEEFKEDRFVAGGEALPVRLVMDKEPTGYVAVPVYSVEV